MKVKIYKYSFNMISRDIKLDPFYPRFGQMSKKIKSKKIKSSQFQTVVGEYHPEKSNTLIFVGVIISMSSIGLLIFVLSEKVFHLS